MGLEFGLQRHVGVGVVVCEREYRKVVKEDDEEGGYSESRNSSQSYSSFSGFFRWLFFRKGTRRTGCMWVIVIHCA